MKLISKSKAPYTMKAYTPVINKWKSFCHQRGYSDATTVEHLAEFITHLSIQGEPLSTFLKISPAMTLYHEANNIPGFPSVAEPFIKLLQRPFSIRSICSFCPSCSSQPILSIFLVKIANTVLTLNPKAASSCSYNCI